MDTAQDIECNDSACCKEEGKIVKKFAYHTPSEDALARITDIRTAFSQLEKEMNGICPGSREFSVALTHLETSCMWAIKSVVSNDPNSVPQA